MKLEEILVQVKEGKLGPAEAEGLIRNLNKEGKPREPILEDLSGRIKDMVETISVNKADVKKTVKDVMKNKGVQTGLNFVKNMFSSEGEKVQEGEIPLEGAKKLSISCPIGDIMVRPNGVDAVHFELSGSFGPELWGVKVGRRDDELVLDVESEMSTRKSMSFGGNLTLDLLIPKGLEIAVEGKSADVDVEELSNDLSINLLSGDVRVRESDGTLTAETMSGDIEVEHHKGAIQLETKSGDIGLENCISSGNARTMNGDLNIENCTGEIECSSMSGDCNVEDSKGTLTVDLKNGDLDIERFVGGLKSKLLNGDISWESSTPILEGEYELYTNNGDIEVSIPSESSATVRVQTISGDTRLRGLNKAKGGFSEKGIIIGEGQAQISLKCISGDVALEVN
jgi:DUF4097 and DUF4098 domain-containing protein YvlB